MADLYIRSKDRKRIEKMRHIAYEPMSDFSFGTGKSTKRQDGHIFVNNRNMGEYTEEQAKEILDFIFDMLEPTVLSFQSESKTYQLPTFEEK